jgi:hypothetical protein
MRDGQPFRISHVTEKKWNRWIPQVGPVLKEQLIKVWLLPLRVVQPIGSNSVTLAFDFGKLVSAKLADLVFIGNVFVLMILHFVSRLTFVGGVVFGRPT